MSFFRSTLAARGGTARGFHHGLLVLMATSLSIGLARADVIEVTEESQLAPDRVVLDFAGRARCSAADNFRNWGIGIGSDGGFTPVVEQIFVLGFVASFLRNGTCTETPAGDDSSPLLIFDFKYPVTEAVFSLVNGGPGVTAELKAYDSAGRLLGTFQSPEIDAAQGVFFGIKATSGPPISKVTIGYSSSELEEQVTDFSVAYQTRPDFASVIPQIGDAVLGSGALRTIIVVMNLTDSTAQGQVALFSQDGSEMDLELAGGGGTALATDGGMANAFSIPPGGSAVLTTPGTSEPVVQGYAIVGASVPVQSTAVFQILDGAGAPTLEAGIAGTQEATFQSATVSLGELGSVDTGVALANTSDTTASVSLQLVNTDNVELGFRRIDMEPGTHMAGFVPGLFPGAPANFAGSILINSDVPVAATVIRTLSGLVSASLQVAQ